MNTQSTIFKTVFGSLVLFTMMLAPIHGWGQLLLVDDFTGLTLGNLAGQSNWTKGGSGPDATIGNATVLTYTNYNGGGAEYVIMPTGTGTSSRVYKALTSTPAPGTNTFYYSLLLRLTSTTATGDYFISLGDATTGTNYFARLFAKTSGAGFVIGGAKNANVGTANFGTTIFSLNTTYLIVVRLTCVAGTANDLMYVWVNPALTSEPATGNAEVTVTSSLADGGGTTVGNFHWHNRTANNPAGSFDGIRVAYGATSTAAWTNLAALTGSVAPSVTTTAASAIESTSATFNGNITSDGGSPILDRGFCYKTSAGVTILDNKTSEGGTTTGAYSKSFSPLSSEVNYFYRAWATNSVGTTLSSTEINFWTFSTEPSSHSTTFTNNVISQTQIDLSFDAASTIANADGYIILRKIGSSPTGLPTDGNAYSVGSIIGDANVAAIVASTSATSASINGLSAGTNYYFTIISFNWNGTDGATYNYKTDGTIPSTNGTTLVSFDLTSEVSGPALGSQPNPVSISSLVTTDPAAVRVFDMDIYDYGTDGQPTKITQVTIKTGTNNTANWLNIIQGVKLSKDGGSTFVTIGAPTITASSIVIPITSGNLNVPDASALTLSLYIYLKSSGLTDNVILEFKVDATASSHGFIADATGSTFLATFASAPVSNQMYIEVVATKLNFVQQSSSTLVNAIMTPAVTIEATDANNNRDLDVAGSVSITSSGTMTGPVTATLASGFGTAGNIVHTSSGTSLNLTAAFGSLTNAVSNPFSITPLLAAGDILFIGYGTTDPDKFAFRVMNTILDGTQINFTDNAWTGTALNTNEGTITWTVPSGGVSTGTIVTITGTTTASIGTVTSSGSYALATGGDQILAYQGSSSSPSFIVGVSSTGWITSGTPTTNTSYLPSVLAIYTSAVGFASNSANGYYSGPMTVTNSTMIAFICNGLNWTRSTTIQTFPAWSFTLGTATIIDVTATAQDLIINSGESLTINEGKDLTVNGTMTNNAGTAGLLIKSSSSGTGSLIHSTAAVPATVDRYITGSSTAWHFLSSPVASQAINPAFTAAATTDYDFFAWYEPTSTWVNFKNTTAAPTWNDANGSTDFTVGKGYLVEYLGTDLTKQFQGNLNTGTVSFPLLNSGSGTYIAFNLAGNPYPSAIDWKASSGWSRGSLVLNSGGYDMSIWNDAVGNYGSFNSAGSSGNNGVTQYIPAAQGFMVKAASAGTLGMDNGIRVHDNQAWLKSTGEIANILRLKASGNVNSYSDEIVIEFGHQDATGGAEKMFGFYETAPSLYTVKSTGNYSIDFRGDPGAVVIPVSFKAGADGNYSLTASQIESFTSSTMITLEDVKDARTQNLMQNPVYNFSATKNDEGARFLLHFGGAFSVNDKENGKPVSIYASGNSVYISNQSGTMLKGEVIVYNMIGQPVMSQHLSENPLTKINLSGTTGYYLIKVITGNNAYSGKVFINQE